MEIYELVGVLITVGIFIVALISGFFAIYSFTGVRTNYRLSKLEEGQKNLNKRMDKLEDKIDQIIMFLNGNPKALDVKEPKNSN